MPQIKLSTPLATLLILCLTPGCGTNSGGNNENNGNNLQSFAGCYVPNATMGSVGCGTLNTLGDPSNDATFQAEIYNQTQFWQNTPAQVFILNDCGSPNAYSLPTRDIMYGIGLFQALVAGYGGDSAPISGVLAHEWGHQVQFDNGWSTSTEPTARPIELEADAFSGYYMALGPDNFGWFQISDYFSAVASLGDYDFNEPSHHGTPQERLAAAQLGFQAAINVAQTGIQYDYSQLHEIFSGAIAGFSNSKVGKIHTTDPLVSHFSKTMDVSQVREILVGASRGRDIAVPQVVDVDRERLYPRKQPR